MQPLTPAARRFYRAFYQWNVAHSTPTTAAAATSIRTCPQAGRQVGLPSRRQRYQSTVTASSHASTEEAAAASTAPPPTPTLTPTPTPDLPPTPRRGQKDTGPARWRTDPVVPSSALARWEGAIRARSPESITWEIAIPEKDTARLTERYGEQLEELATRFNAHVLLGQSRPARDEHDRAYTARRLLVQADWEAAAKIHVIVSSIRHRAENAERRERKRLDADFARRTAGVEHFKRRTAKGTQDSGRGSWRTQPVCSAEEKAAGDLEAWESVVRHRSAGEDASSTRLTVELAVPGTDKIAALKKMYGEELLGVRMRTEAAVELGASVTKTPPSKSARAQEVHRPRLYPVLVSGTYEQVAKADTLLTQFRSPGQWEDWNVAQAKRELRDHPNSSTSTPLPPSPSVPWLDNPVESHLARPSATIPPFAIVWRSRAENASHGTVETAFPDDLYQAMQARAYDLPATIRRAGVRVEIAAAPILVVAAKDPHARIPVRPILLSGKTEALVRAVTGVHSQKGFLKQPRPQAQEGAAAGTVERRVTPSSSTNPPPPSTPSDPLHTLPLPEQLRHILRPLTHPVVLITSCDPTATTTSTTTTSTTTTSTTTTTSPSSSSSSSSSSPSSFHTYRAVTVSSFTSLTLHPTPHLTFNLKLPSRTWSALAASHRFSVHLLSGTRAGAGLADVFVRPYARPEEAWEAVVTRLGAAVGTDEQGSPRIGLPGAVLGRVSCRLLPGKCVEVGDHVVVVGCVEGVWRGGLEEGVGGLGYAMGGYRGEGRVLEVERGESGKGVETGEKVGGIEGKEGGKEGGKEAGKIEGMESGKAMEGGKEVGKIEGMESGKAMEGGKEVGRIEGKETELSEEDDEDVFKPEEMHGRVGKELQGDDAYWAKAALDWRSEAMEEEDEYDLGFAPPAVAATNADDKSSTARDRPADERHPSVTAEQTAEKQLHGDVGELLNSARGTPRNVPSSSPPWVVKRARIQAQDAHLRHQQQQQVKSFSTSTIHAAAPSDPNDDPSKPHPATPTSTNPHPSTPPAPRDPTTCVTDPALLPQTIATFLNHPTTTRPRIPRMRAVLRAHDTAAHASRTLQAALAEGTLTPDLSLHLEQTILTHERRVHKTLGLRAAQELTALLDEGRVDVRTARWSEMAVERAMRVVGEELEGVRGLWEQGRLERGEWERVRERLGAVLEGLGEVVGRLRDLVREEEGD